MEKENINKKAVIIVLAILAVFALGFLGYRFFAPFGKTVYYHFTSKLPGAEEATTFSLGKDSILKIPSQIIKTSQSKLSLKLLSKDIESIKATLKFKKGPKEIKLGVRGNEKDKFLYQPLYHSLLRDLDWKKIEEGGFILWQKEKKYQNLYDFINNPSLDAETASYFIDQDKLLFLEPTAVGSKNKVVIETHLRCDHTSLVRVDRKPLVLTVAKQDINFHEGKDKIKIIFSKGQKILVEKEIQDDEITDRSQLKTEPQEEKITLENIEPGIYQLDIIYEGIGCDAKITKIEINQQKVIFKNSIAIVGTKPTSLWTNISKISIATGHEEGIQTVKLNDKEELKIEKANKNFFFDLGSFAGKKETDRLYKLESPQNDLVFRGEGYFAFSEDSFFYPEILESVDLNTLDSLDDVDYVLTTCPQARTEGNWLIAEASFDPKDIKIDGDKLYFSLEVPELSKYGGELEIDYLEIAVKHKGVLEKEETTEEEISAEELEKVKESKNIFQRIWQSVFNFFNRVGASFANTIFKVFRKETKPSEEEEPVTSPTPSPSPSPTPAAEKISLLIRVLNGGAGKGEAGKFAKKLEENGFTNTKADNADKSDYKNAIVKYRSEDKDVVNKITNLLKEEYKTIDKKEIATTSAEIVVIIGEK